MSAASYRRAPVFYTLAQISFAPVTKIADYIPDIQERLRHKGYPHFREQTGHQHRLESIAGHDPKVEVTSLHRWVLMDQYNRYAIVLEQDTFAFHCTEHPGFEAFMESMETALCVVQDILGIELVEQVGVRYLNAVATDDEHALEQLLEPGVLGFSGQLEGDFRNAYSETVYAVGDGMMAARSFVTDRGLFLPPDLESAPLKIDDDLLGLEGRRIAILDLDRKSQCSMPLSSEQVVARMRTCHDGIREAFMAMTTSEARERWNLSF